MWLHEALGAQAGPSPKTVRLSRVSPPSIVTLSCIHLRGGVHDRQHARMWRVSKRCGVLNMQYARFTLHMRDGPMVWSFPDLTVKFSLPWSGRQRALSQSRAPYYAVRETPAL